MALVAVLYVELTPKAAPPRPFREKNADFAFINPLLYYDVPDEYDSGAYRDLEGDLRSYIAQMKTVAGVQDVSVYFSARGRWMGINEDDTYRPKSLLKVPFMIAYLKKAEGKGDLLTKRLPYSEALRAKYVADPAENNSALVPGETYDVATLLKKMVIDSDNVAKDILLADLDEADTSEVFKDLGIEVPKDNEPDYAISAKLYASFFRVLYNSTYLDRDSSEWALSLLSQAQFEKGLRAGVPAEVPLAHKYGIEAATYEGDDLQLHDCGFVYYPDSPYLLCVMTRGHNIGNLGTTIAGISKMVYEKMPDIMKEE
jgi:beta-lactamase class A